MKLLVGIALAIGVVVLSPSTLNICPRPNTLSQKELHCLAANVYHEARGEPYLGKLLVARTTLNRVLHEDYPNTVCKVVFQPKQFSWTINTKKIVFDSQSLLAAYNAQWYRHEATHFHATYVKPKWAKTMIKLDKVGNHVFYKDRSST